MNRRDLIKSGIGGAVGLAAARALRPAQAAAGRQDLPNVLTIIVHDLGTALACYGEPVVKTPRLDQLAAEGARFSSYFCASTPCSPSRGCIVTGRYAHTNGLIGLANEGWSLPASERTVIDHMNDAGYYTANFGGQHERIGPVGQAYRYRQVGRPGRATCDRVADEVCAFLKAWDLKQGRFYVNAYSQDVHAPWDRPEFQGKYRPEEIRVRPFLPDIANVRRPMSQFYGSISVMDAAVGRILDTLRQTGLAENTLVIFTTDHGISFPRAKSTLYDPGLTTALIMRWPGHIKPGSVVAHPINNIDLLPSQLELLGLPAGAGIQGRSFAPALLGGQYAPNEATFHERNYHDDYDPTRAVRTARHKLIRNYGERPRYKLPAEATEQDTLGTLGNSGEPRAFEELYDLEKDPWEFSNVAGDPAYAGVLKELRARLDGWMHDTGDYMRGARQFVDFPTIDRRTLPADKLTAGPTTKRPRPAPPAGRK